jgi:hypothetical protein
MGYFDDAQDLHLIDFWPDGKVNEAYYNSWASNNLIIGPLGSGKTQTTIMKCLDIITEMPVDKNGIRRSRGLVLRNFENDLRNTTIKDWLEIVPEDFGTFRSTSPITHYLNFEDDLGVEIQAEVIFFPLDNPGMVKKLRGMQLTWLWVNEAKEVDQDIITMAQSRLGRYPAYNDMPELPGSASGERYWFGSVMDTNAPDDEHWAYQICENPTPAQKSEWAVFRQPGGVMQDPSSGQWIANPRAENLKNLNPNYYKKQLALNVSDDWIRVNLGNEWGATVYGRKVWEEYQPNVHESSTDDFIPGLQVYMGVDYGRTPAATLFQEQSGGYVFFDEYPCTGMSAERFAPNLALYLMKTWGLKTSDVIGYDDPAGSDKKENSETSAHEVMRDHGFKMHPAPLSNQDLTRRRKAMSDPLCRLRPDGKSCVQIHKRCKTLRMAGASKFYYRQLNTAYDDLYTELPVKNHWSHTAESAEYGLAGRGEGQTAKTQNRPKKKPTNRRPARRRAA